MSRLNRRGFWGMLPRNRKFLVALAAFLPGTALGVHFASKIGASRDAITFGVAWAIVSTGGLILYLAYREHSATAKQSHLKSDDVITIKRDRAKREMLAG